MARNKVLQTTHSHYPINVRPDRTSGGTAGPPGPAATAGAIAALGYWSPLVEIDPVLGPQLVYDGGDTIAVWTPTP